MKWVVSGRLEATQPVECVVTPAVNGGPEATPAGAQIAGAQFTVRVGTEIVSAVVKSSQAPWVIHVRGRAFEVARHGAHGFSCNGIARTVTRAIPGARAAGPAGSSGRLVAPMPGRVLRVCCAPGDVVTRGQALIVLEAMKMESEQLATISGTVREVYVRDGDSVDAGAALIQLDPTIATP